jgi:hypothetical protein
MGKRKFSKDQPELPFEKLPVAGNRRRLLEGMMAGRWKIVEYAGYHRRSEQSVYLVECQCELKTRRLMRQVWLVPRKRDGKIPSSSCGCLRREKLKKDGNHAFVHGHCGRNKWSPEYRVWASVKQRCRNSLAYVEKGIRMCAEWQKSFLAFLAGVGPRPSLGHTLDRLDNSKGYEPGNVRWATHDEQARNKGSNRNLAYKGQTLCLADWAKRLGVSDETISRRLRLGWTVEKTLSTPPRRRLDLTQEELV